MPAAAEKASPTAAVETPLACSWSGTSRLITVLTNPPSPIRTTLAITRGSAVVALSQWPSWLASVPCSSTAGDRHRPAPTTAVAAAAIRNGAANPSWSTNTPAKAGPATLPSPATVMVNDTARSLRPGATSVSQAIPVVHNTPKATPNSSRATISSQKSAARPWPASATTSSPTAARVTWREPNRVPSQLAGSDTAKMVRLADASSTPASKLDRSSRWLHSGISGAAAPHIASPRKMVR